MAYTKTNWVSGETPLSAENLNNIENGVKANEDAINAVNARIAVGTAANVVSVAAGAYEDRVYSFGKTFSAVPKVFLSLTGDGDSGKRGSVSAFVKSTTTTDVTVRYYNNSDVAFSNLKVSWFAIGS